MHPEGEVIRAGGDKEKRGPAVQKKNRKLEQKRAAFPIGEQVSSRKCFPSETCGVDVLEEEQRHGKSTRRDDGHKGELGGSNGA